MVLFGSNELVWQFVIDGMAAGDPVSWAINLVQSEFRNKRKIRMELASHLPWRIDSGFPGQDRDLDVRRSLVNGSNPA